MLSHDTFPFDNYNLLPFEIHCVMRQRLWFYTSGRPISLTKKRNTWSFRNSHRKNFSGLNRQRRWSFACASSTDPQTRYTTFDNVSQFSTKINKWFGLLKILTFQIIQIGVETRRDFSQWHFLRWASLKVLIRTTGALQVEARVTGNEK